MGARRDTGSPGLQQAGGRKRPKSTGHRHSRSKGCRGLTGRGLLSDGPRARGGGRGDVRRGGASGTGGVQTEVQGTLAYRLDVGRDERAVRPHDYHGGECRPAVRPVRHLWLFAVGQAVASSDSNPVLPLARTHSSSHRLPRVRSTGLHLFEEVEGSKRSRRQTTPLVAADPEQKQSYATPKPPVRGRGRGRGRGGQAAASASAAGGRGRGRGRGTKAKAAPCDAEKFHVAAIKAVRGGVAGRTWEFLVSWEGFDEAHDSWEPELNLLDYKAELEQVRGARHAQRARAGRAGRGGSGGREGVSGG